MGHQSDSTIITYKERGISMSKKKVVVSLGHDALGYTIMEQWDAVKDTAKALADLVEADYQLTITHSNGPQVSMIHKAMTELRRIYIDYTPAPMCVCSAMSQGYVGYDIQNSLKAELMSRGITKPVSTILTQVTVDPYDEAFYAPQKAARASSVSSLHQSRSRSWRSMRSAHLQMQIRSLLPAVVAVFRSSNSSMLIRVLPPLSKRTALQESLHPICWQMSLSF